MTSSDEPVSLYEVAEQRRAAAKSAAEKNAAAIERAAAAKTEAEAAAKKEALAEAEAEAEGTAAKAAAKAVVAAAAVAKRAAAKAEAAFAKRAEARAEARATRDAKATEAEKVEATAKEAAVAEQVALEAEVALAAEVAAEKAEAAQRAKAEADQAAEKFRALEAKKEAMAAALPRPPSPQSLQSVEPAAAAEVLTVQVPNGPPSPAAAPTVAPVPLVAGSPQQLSVADEMADETAASGLQQDEQEEEEDREERERGEVPSRAEGLQLQADSALSQPSQPPAEVSDTALEAAEAYARATTLYQQKVSTGASDSMEQGKNNDDGDEEADAHVTSGSGDSASGGSCSSRISSRLRSAGSIDRGIAAGRGFSKAVDAVVEENRGGEEEEDEEEGEQEEEVQEMHKGQRLYLSTTTESGYANVIERKNNKRKHVGWRVCAKARSDHMHAHTLANLTCHTCSFIPVVARMCRWSSWTRGYGRRARGCSRKR